MPKAKYFLFHLSALAFFAGAYALLYPIGFDRLNQGFLGGARSDPAIYIWLMINNAKNVLTWPSQGFDIGIYYPYGRALAYTDNFLLPSLIAKPFLSLGFSAEVVFNVIVISAGILNGFCTFALVYYLTDKFLPSLVSGVAFLGCPFISAHLPHIQLQFAFFLPCILLSLTIVVCRCSKLSATCVGLGFFASFLCSVYYTLFALIIAPLYLLALLIVQRFRNFAHIIKQLFVWNIPWFIALYFVSKPYREVAKEFGVRRAGEVYPLQATLASYLAIPEDNLLWGAHSPLFSHFEARFFPGITVASLVVAGLIIFLLNSKAYQCILAVIALLAIGISQILNSSYAPYISAGGFWLIIVLTLLIAAQRKGDKYTEALPNSALITIFFLLLFVAVFVSLGFLAPGDSKLFEPGLFSILFRNLPGFGAIRAIGRFGVVAYLSFAVVSGLVLANFAARFSKWTAAGVSLVILGAVLFELRAAPRLIEAEPPMPGVWKALAQLPGHEAVLALPYGYIPEVKGVFALMQTDYMRFSQPSNRPIMNGHSGVMPGFLQVLDLKMRRFPDPRSLGVLREIMGLRYIVVMPKYDSRFDRQTFEAALTEHQAELSLIEKDSDGNYLLEFHPQRELTTKAFDLVFPPDTNNVRNFKFAARCETLNKQVCSEEIRINLATGDKPDSVTEHFTVRPQESWQELQAEIPPSRSAVGWHQLRMDVDKVPANSRIELQISQQLPFG